MYLTKFPNPGTIIFVYLHICKSGSYISLIVNYIQDRKEVFFYLSFLVFCNECFPFRLAGTEDGAVAVDPTSRLDVLSACFLASFE